MGDISIVISDNQYERLRAVLPRTAAVEWSLDRSYATVRGLTVEQVTAITRRHMDSGGKDVAVVNEHEFPVHDPATDLFLWHESTDGQVICRIVTVADDDVRARLKACLPPGFPHTCRDLSASRSFLFVWHAIVFGPEPDAIPPANHAEMARVKWNACVTLHARSGKGRVVGFNYDELLRVAETARTVDATLTRRIVPDDAPHYAYTMRGLHEFLRRQPGGHA